jgi:hypothetical protein
MSETSFRPSHEQYIALIDRLAQAGLVQWLPGPSGPRHGWRLLVGPGGELDEERWDVLLETLDPREQAVFDLVVRALQRLT